MKNVLKLFLCVVLLSASWSCSEEQEAQLNLIEVYATQNQEARNVARYWFGIGGEIDFGRHDRFYSLYLRSGDELLATYVNQSPHLVTISVFQNGKEIFKESHTSTEGEQHFTWVIE